MSLRVGLPRLIPAKLGQHRYRRLLAQLRLPREQALCRRRGLRRHGPPQALSRDGHRHPLQQHLPLPPAPSDGDAQAADEAEPGHGGDRGAAPGEHAEGDARAGREGQ